MVSSVLSVHNKQLPALAAHRTRGLHDGQQWEDTSEDWVMGWRAKPTF